MATGKAWFKVPEAIKVNLTGEKPADITGKDVILTLIGMIGVDGALYKSLEFAGPGVKALTMTDRLTISNMAIEAGGKAGIFPFDEITKAYVDARVTKPYEPVAADDDAEYCREVDINLSELKPVVAFPHLPGNTKRVEDIQEPIEIDQVIIGSARTAASRTWRLRLPSSRATRSQTACAASSSRAVRPSTRSR